MAFTYNEAHTRIIKTIKESGHDPKDYTTNQIDECVIRLMDAENSETLFAKAFTKLKWGPANVIRIVYVLTLKSLTAIIKFITPR